MINDYSIDKELLCCLDFLLNCTNLEEGSTGYGLTLDNTKNKLISSIAASGFMLANIPIAIKYNKISYEQGRKIVINTLHNIFDNVENYDGFLAHFVNYNDGKRYRKCEFSTIDTALFIAGAIVCESYFKDDDISFMLDIFISRINWNDFITDYEGKKVIIMAYNDFNHLTKMNYRNKDDGYIFQWHMYAEQFILYLIMASDKRVDDKLAKDIFNGFRRDSKTVEGKSFVRCPTGSLFTYLFTQCFFDFSKYLDANGYDWHENTRLAVIDNYLYCKNDKTYQSFKEGLWGVSASDGPRGYRGFGIPPYDYEDGLEGLITNPEHIDGTIAIYSLILSLPYLPDKVLETLEIINQIHQDAIGEYGYLDAINVDKHWISEGYYGIDKGPSSLMIENYKSKMIWDLFTNNHRILRAVDKLGFIKR